jgi:outer membrane receptor protein involved in Fe transport
VNATNPLNISVGNPTLAPEFTNNYEVSYSKFIKQTYISTSFFVRNTTGAINQIREVRGDTVKTTSQNIGNEDAYGMNVNLNINLSNKLMIGGGGDLSYLVLANNVLDPLLNAKNQGLQSNFRVYGNYNIGNGWGAQIFSFYRVNQVQLQGSQGGFGIYSLSLKKDFKNKKGSIGFGAENFLTPNGFIIRSETQTPVINSKSENTLRNMNFKINFSYRIGKMSFGPTKKKKSVNNDDTKGDGGDSPAPAQPMGMPGMRMGGGGFGGGGPR